LKVRRRVLVIGPAGSGKTHLAKYFEKRGKVAFDCDGTPGLPRVEDAEGNPKEPTVEEWQEWSGLKWMWSRKKIEALLAANPEVYLFGVADNMYDFKPLFDELYFLKADRELIAKRLQNETRKNDFGRSPKQRDLVLNTLDNFAEDARKRGFKFIDASLSASKIFEIICGDSKIMNIKQRVKPRNGLC